MSLRIRWALRALNIATTMPELISVSTPVTGDKAISTDPASRLPPELLVHCLSREHGLDSDDFIRASHVSSSWRSITLAEPTLWSKLHATKLPGLPLVFNSELLARSGAVPLDVTMIIDVGYMRWDLEDSELVLSALPHFWDRTKCLELCFMGEHDGRDGWSYQGRFDFLRTPAPILKLLRVIDRVYADMGSGLLQVDDNLYWRVTNDLLGGRGALETLDVEGTMLQLPERCPALSTITSFHGRLHEESHIPQHMSLLCPRLRCLRLLDFYNMLQPFSAGDFRGVKELRLGFHGTPEGCDLVSLFRHVTLPEPIATAIVTATCWTPGNIEFLTRNRTIQRIQMYNLPVFAEQTEADHSILAGHASYQNWSKDQTLIVTNAVAVSNRLSMQTILTLGPTYHNIQELSLGFDLLLPFLETSPIMTALFNVTVLVPAGQYDAEWHDGRFIVGPRRLLVHLGLDHRHRAESPFLPPSIAPSDAWRATFDWGNIAIKLPTLRTVQIQTNPSYLQMPELQRKHTHIYAAEVKALVELGLGRLNCEPRSLAKLSITGVHFVDGEADTLLSLAELAQELVIDRAAYEVTSLLPTVAL